MYRVEFLDGEWITGIRGFSQQLQEPFGGARRIKAIDASTKLRHLIGHEFNVPTTNLRCFEYNYYPNSNVGKQNASI